MKKIVLIIFLINFSSLKGQEKPTILKNNPFKKVTLNFRSGDTINGFAKLNSFNKIVFKKNEDAEKKKYDHKTVRGITIYIDTIKKEYEFKIINENKFRGKTDIYYHLLEPVMIGKVSVYLDDYQAHDAVTLKKNIGYTTYSTPHRFYISKGTSDVVTILGTVKPFSFDKQFDFKLYYSTRISTISDLKINPNSNYFKKITKKYFSDCPELMSKIESKYFNKKELLSVLNYYNKDCQ